MTKQQAKKLAKDFRLGNRFRKKNLMKQFNIKPATSSNTGRLKMGIRIDIENNPRDYVAALDDDGKLVFFSGNPIRRIPAIELFDTPKATKKESVNEVKTNKFTLNDMDDNDAAVVVAMAKKAGVFLRTKKVSMKRSDVELKGDKKKLFKFINSLPESVEDYNPKKDHSKDPKSHVKLDKNTGMFGVYDMKGKKHAEFKSKKDAEEYSVKQHDKLMNESTEAENRLKRLTRKKVTVTTPNDSFTGKLVFNFGYLNRSEYFVDGHENKIFTARDVKSILGNKIKLTKNFDAMESTSVDRQLVVLETILKNEDVDLILQFNESHEFDIRNISINEVRKQFNNFKLAIEEKTQYQLVAIKKDGTELKSKFYEEENMLADMQQKCEDSDEYESTSVLKRVVDTDEEDKEEKKKDSVDEVTIRQAIGTAAGVAVGAAALAKRAAAKRSRVARAQRKLDRDAQRRKDRLTIAKAQSVSDRNKIRDFESKLRDLGTGDPEKRRKLRDKIDKAKQRIRKREQRFESVDGRTKPFKEKVKKLNYEKKTITEKEIKGLRKKADKSGMPYGILKQVYNRGMAAWKTGHRPGTTPQQWAMARVNSFVTKSSGTWGKADKDLAAKVRARKK